MNKLKSSLSPRTAFIAFTAVSCIALAYHALIITQVIPYANVWGGRLKSLTDMYRFETVSVLMQLAFPPLAWLRYRRAGSKTLQKVLSFVFYGMFGLLLLNTLGNIVSTSRMEAIIFTPMTFIMSFVALRLALD